MKLTIVIILIMIFILSKKIILETEKFSGVELNLTYQDLEKEDFYILLTEKIAKEKISFIITDDKEYYYIKYYSIPLHFIPISKYKMQKEDLKIINYKEASENYFGYNCIGNFKIKGQADIDYYNAEIKKDCLNIP